MRTIRNCIFPVNHASSPLLTDGVPVMRYLLLMLMLATSLMVSRPVVAETLDVEAIAAELGRNGDVLVGRYDPQHGDATADSFSDLYFGGFEGSGMEAAIGSVDSALKADLESEFSAIIGMAYRGAPAAEMAATWQKLRGDLAAAATAMAARSDQGPIAVLLQSLLIMLREGAEAIVVVGALIAFLRRVGAADSIPVVWLGVWCGVAASLLTAWVFRVAIDLAGPALEAVEGAVLVMAALVLAYVSHWLFLLHDAGRWQAFLRDRMRRAMVRGRLWPLAGAAFLAVYREGAETVLFYQALLMGAEGREMAVTSGALIGLAGLGGLYLVFRLLPPRLPLASFLAATAVPLYGLAIVFAGQGIATLQGAGLLSSTNAPWVPHVAWLGLSPTVETLAAQIVVALLLVPFHLLGARRRRQVLA